jgi:hypothetical protein
MQEVDTLQIQLRDNEAVIEKLWNGFSIGRSYISPSDLAYSMLDILENEELVQHLLEDKSLLEVFQPFLENERYVNGDQEEELIQILQLAIDNVPNQSEAMVRDLYTQLCRRFNPSELNGIETSRILSSFISTLNKQDFSEPDDYHLLIDLFHSVLEKVNLLGERSYSYSAKILKQLYKQLEFYPDREIAQQLFKVAADKADKSWILDVLSQYIDKEKVCSSPLLPKNCFIYQEMLDGSSIVGIEVDAQRFNVIYHRKSFEQVGHPKMLFLFTIRNKKLLKAELVCVKDKLLKSDTQLYRYPFSNVFHNLSCCWPDLKTYLVKDLSMVGTLPYAFINSPNNDHAYGGTNLGERFYHLQEKDFNNEELVPLKFCLSDWLELQRFNKE